MSKRTIFFTDAFTKQYELLTEKETQHFKSVIQELSDEPDMGEHCKGELLDVWVYSYLFQDQSYLLAYCFDNKELNMLALDVQIAFES